MHRGQGVMEKEFTGYQRMVELILENGQDLVLALFILVAGIISAKYANKIIRRALSKLSSNTAMVSTASNAFFVLDGVLFTHPLGSKILPGVTRQIVLELSAELGLKVEQVPRTIDDFAVGDEVFLTGTIREIQPVVQINDRKIGSGQPGPVTRRLCEAFQDRVAAECGCT